MFFSAFWRHPPYSNFLKTLEIVFCVGEYLITVVSHYPVVASCCVVGRALTSRTPLYHHEPFVPAAKSTSFPRRRHKAQVCGGPAQGAAGAPRLRGGDGVPAFVLKNMWNELFSLYFTPLSSQKQLANSRLQKSSWGQCSWTNKTSRILLKKTVFIKSH